jgi:hypothetical protein
MNKVLFRIKVRFMIKVRFRIKVRFMIKVSCLFKLLFLIKVQFMIKVRFMNKVRLRIKVRFMINVIFVPLLLLGPPIFPINLFLSATLLTVMTGISLHMQWPLISQSHSLLLKVLFLHGSATTYLYTICLQEVGPGCLDEFSPFRRLFTLGSFFFLNMEVAKLPHVTKYGPPFFH